MDVDSGPSSAQVTSKHNEMSGNKAPPALEVTQSSFTSSGFASADVEMRPADKVSQDKVSTPFALPMPNDLGVSGEPQTSNATDDALGAILASLEKDIAKASVGISNAGGMSNGVVEPDAKRMRLNPENVGVAGATTQGFAGNTSMQTPPQMVGFQFNGSVDMSASGSTPGWFGRPMHPIGLTAAKAKQHEIASSQYLIPGASPHAIGGTGPALGSSVGAFSNSVDTKVEQFIQESRIDPGCAERLRQVSPEIQNKVLAGGPVMNTAQPSAEVRLRILDAQAPPVKKDLPVVENNPVLDSTSIVQEAAKDAGKDAFEKELEKFIEDAKLDEMAEEMIVRWSLQFRGTSSILACLTPIVIIHRLLLKAGSTNSSRREIESQARRKLHRDLLLLVRCSQREGRIRTHLHLT